MNAHRLQTLCAALSGPVRASAQVCLVAGVIGISWLSLTPDPSLQRAIGLSDKLEHALAYGLLAAAGSLAVSSPRSVATLASALVIFGAALELGQHYIPARTASLGDIAANAAGVTVGLACGLLLKALAARARV